VLKLLSIGLVTESYLTETLAVTANSGALAKAANPVDETPVYTAGLSIVTLKDDMTVDAILFTVVAAVNVDIEIGAAE
jgi:hypothetical protein